MKNIKEYRKECNQCHSNLHLHLLTNYTRKDGTIRLVYRCNKCNRERMHQYWNTEKGRRVALESNKRSYYKYREKAMARSLFGYYKRKGYIKKLPCRCGEQEVQAHHEDYSKPLEVIWLYHSCHTEKHRKLRTAINSA